MAPDNTDPDEPSDESPENSPDQRQTLLDQIRVVIDALAEIEEEEGGHRRASSQIDHRFTRIDYDYDVSIGLGPRDRRASSPDRPAVDRSRTAGKSPNQAGPKDATHIETREVTDQELVVTADLPGVAEDELDISLDADEPALVLTADGEIIDRIGLDQSNVTISGASLNNQILEIRLERSGDSNGGESA